MARETFALAYGSGGAFTFGDIQEMTWDERDTYLELLIEQKQAEEREITKARNKAKSKRR